MDKKIYDQELKHLNQTQNILREAKSILETGISQIGGENLETLKDLRANPETNGADFFFFLEQLNEKNAQFNLKDKFKRLEEIESLLKETYFARLDFTKPEEQIYIGKFGFTHDKPEIIDWRAKIASVYYRYRYPQKNVKYETPDGDVVRDLTTKRTFEIDDGSLIKYYNNDIQLDESEIITDKIKTRTGGVLEDIVETIQEGQLDIIEADPRQITIVQGCVGSGKSTVAIHKLSHIFFNFPDLIKPERCILIAKNQILVGYLSTLFPKLGIFDIYYKTLKDLVVNIIYLEELKLKYDLSLNQNTKDFDLSILDSFNAKLSKVHDHYETQIDKILENPEFKSFGGFVYNPKQPVYANLTEYIEELEEELENQTFNLKEHSGSAKEWLWKDNIKALKKMINAFKKLRTQLKETTYLEMLAELKVNPHAKLGYYECLLAIYVYTELIGIRNLKKFEYAVVDEGQDFSVLEYLVMGKIVINGRFCILGDLNQSYQVDGLTSWDDIGKAIKEARNAQTFELDTNYRSTKPIIDLANKILSPYSKNYLPKSINRRGLDPVMQTFSNQTELVTTFKDLITKDLKTLNKSIGVIAFSKELFDEAEKVILETNLDQEKYIKLDSSRKIVYLPQAVYLTRFEDCKGLEFAKVYVLGLNLDNVSNYPDAKKAFVSVTRAMNELVVLG